MFVTQVQMQYNKNPESLQTCCKILLQNTTTFTNPTLHLHTKDMPLHQQKFYTHNLNGIDLQKTPQLTPKYHSILFLNLFHCIICNFNLNTCCIFYSHLI
jgi:uncharacterized protein YjbI with pentapeptide repeats